MCETLEQFDAEVMAANFADAIHKELTSATFKTEQFREAIKTAYLVGWKDCELVKAIKGL